MVDIEKIIQNMLFYINVVCIVINLYAGFYWVIVINLIAIKMLVQEVSKQ